jgi:hypothetical protein
MSPDASHVRTGLQDEANAASSPVRSSTAGRKRRLVVARVARVMARRDAASDDSGARRRIEGEDVDLARRS